LKRAFSGVEPFEGRLSLTHDLPQYRLRWSISYETPTREVDYLIDETDRRFDVGHLDAFVEYRPAPQWTVRIFGQDLTQPAFVRTRTLYAALRDGPVASIDRRRLNNGALYGINIRFAFGG
jgi:hypothetical protein